MLNESPMISYRNLIAVAGLICLMSGCNNDDCIDESKKRSGNCPMNYLPVCGCDGKTYGNSCAADLAGVTSYEQGACAD